MTEEVETSQPIEMMPPAVEEVIHNAMIEVRKVPISPTEEITLLRFHTPFKVFTIKLDDNGIEALLKNIRQATGTPNIVIASPGDIPQLKV